MTTTAGTTEKAVRGFAASYGRGPDLVWSAPGRANLIGEHTDYNQGFVLPFAIAERTAVAVGHTARPGDPVITVASAEYPGMSRARLPDIAPGSVTGWSGYPLGVAWALSKRDRLSQSGRRDPSGADLFIASAVPAGAGLSSSAALEIAAACALNDLWELDLAARDLAHAGQCAENEIVGAPTGIMDQYASLLGAPDAAVFLDCRTEFTRNVPLRLPQAGLALVLIDTRERHSHASGGYAARRASCERAARELGVPALRDIAVADLPRAEKILDEETFRRARHVVTENARVEATVAALEHDDWPEVGRNLTASHASMRDDFEITTPALDLAVAVAIGNGALGARMTGGGFGGAAIALIAIDAVQALTSATQDAFRNTNLSPDVRTVTPSPGAQKEPRHQV